MTFFEHNVILLNALFAFISFLINARAVRVLPAGRLRMVFTSIAFWSLFYVGGYTWLWLYRDVLGWSTILRGISLLVWPLVWMAPAWVITQEYLALRMKYEELKAEIKEMKCSPK